MGEGKYFIPKLNVVVAEKANGLRPRLKRVLSFMFKEDLCKVYNKKAAASSKQTIEVTDTHVNSFIGE